MRLRMPSLIADYWRRENGLGLFLDYDGTLTPIVPNPEQAFLPREGVELLRNLCRDPQIQVAVISGRSLSQLQHFLAELAGEEMTLCGSHGGEIYLPKKGEFLRQPDRQELPQALALIRADILQQLAASDYLNQGVRIEDKPYSFAVHYRQAEPPVKQQVMTLLTHYFSANPATCRPFKLQPGKEVLEILPATFDKGNAVAFLWDNWRLPKGCYIGDDVTDEAAFAAVNQRGGLSIAVGKRPGMTQAQYICPDVAAVYAELAALLES
ncbi:MAG: trehalose-phosphatase [Gloeomargarita sp. SKYG116]|nr:trehalose-phosphatase [Gloeomargarita sp. SKYG116]MDW8402361.1 trehalose-phosphatase [Gloeomargarita sp. SKYGB_i_bin116]